MALRRWLSCAFLAALLASPIAAPAQDGIKTHALTLGDAPKYGPDFKHLDYVNPNAPKGGIVNLYGLGTYDSFNPYIIKGTPAAVPGLIETLTTSPDDDVLSEYGLIAESMEVAPDKSWIIFNLRPEARWHDGKAVTADDVVFSFEALTTKGDPFWRYYYGEVTKAEKLSDLSVKFAFKSGGNRELPVIMGQLPVLPKHWWESRKFEDVLLEPPLGSGPYKVGKFDLGRSFVMERVPDYWGGHLPIRIGTENYDQERYEYFRDPEIAMEAFKAGRVEIRSENSAKRWVTGYDFPAVQQGRVIKEKIPHKNPTGMQGFAFNIRKPLFADPKVREALNYAFDFEWSNRTLFFGEYQRIRSYFQNSEMAATGLPSPEELKILEPLRGQIPERVFTTEYNPPVTDGSGNARENLAKAADLLEQAGWKVENGKRVKDGKPFSFEFLLDDPAFERVAQPLAQNLQRIGVEMTIRLVDSAQYESRLENFDFDLVVQGFGQSLSPGNEQRDFWGSASAKQPGGRNIIGIENPAIDTIVDSIISAPTREDLIIRCRALDRVLQWNFYLIPNFTQTAFRIAYWDKFGMPDKRPDPLYGFGSSAWWVDPAKEAALAGVKAADAQDAPQPAEAPAASAPAAEQPAAAPPAAPAVTSTPVEDRGRSPFIYAGGAIVVFIVAYLLGRRRGKRA